MKGNRMTKKLLVFFLGLTSQQESTHSKVTIFSNYLRRLVKVFLKYLKKLTPYWLTYFKVCFIRTRTKDSHYRGFAVTGTFFFNYCLLPTLRGTYGNLCK